MGIRYVSSIGWGLDMLCLLGEVYICCVYCVGAMYGVSIGQGLDILCLLGRV